METKEKRSFYLKNYNAASSSMLAQSSVHERFINLLHQQTAMLKFLDYNRMLHLSFSSDAQRICTCGSIGASGFKFRVTGTLVIIRVSQLADKCLERLNTDFARICLSTAAQGNLRICRIWVQKKRKVKKFQSSIFFYLFLSFFISIFACNIHFTEWGFALMIILLLEGQNPSLVTFYFFIWRANVALIAVDLAVLYKNTFLRRARVTLCLWSMGRAPASTRLSLPAALQTS